MRSLDVRARRGRRDEERRRLVVRRFLYAIFITSFQ